MSFPIPPEKSFPTLDVTYVPSTLSRFQRWGAMWLGVGSLSCGVIGPFVFFLSIDSVGSPIALWSVLFWMLVGTGTVAGGAAIAIGHRQAEDPRRGLLAVIGMVTGFLGLLICVATIAGWMLIRPWINSPMWFG